MLATSYRCHVTQETMAQTALDDMASTNHQFPNTGFPFYLAAHANATMFPATYGNTCEAGAYARPRLSSACTVFVADRPTDVNQRIPQEMCALS